MDDDRTVGAVDHPDLEEVASGVGADEHHESFVEVVDEHWLVEGVEHVAVVDAVLAGAGCDQRRIHLHKLACGAVCRKLGLHGLERPHPPCRLTRLRIVGDRVPRPRAMPSTPSGNAHGVRERAPGIAPIQAVDTALEVPILVHLGGRAAMSEFARPEGRRGTAEGVLEVRLGRASRFGIARGPAAVSFRSPGSVSRFVLCSLDEAQLPWASSNRVAGGR